MGFTAILGELKDTPEINFLHFYLHTFHKYIQGTIYTQWQVLIFCQRQSETGGVIIINNRPLDRTETLHHTHCGGVEQGTKITECLLNKTENLTQRK